MKKFTLFTAVMLSGGLCFAGGNVHHSHNSKVEKTFLNNKRVPDVAWQTELREQKAWKKFLAQHGTWYVDFNEENHKPHRAYGKPIPVSGTDIADCAMNFIQYSLQDFNIPFNQLELKSTHETNKYNFAYFTQKYLGLTVLRSNMIVKLTKDKKVIMWGADVYNDINISTTPGIGTTQALAVAQANLDETVTSATMGQLYILPVPDVKCNKYKLVYQINVKTIDTENVPANYYTLVDANTGEVVYRANMVHHVGEKQKMPGGIEVNTKATVYTTHSYNPSTVENLPNLNFVVNTQSFVSDLNGYADTFISGPQSGNFELAGLWSTVYNNNITPTTTSNLINGVNNVSFDTDADINERSAYYHVNIVHDHCKSVMPTFTGMDFSLPTNVDVTGTCNAFYDGSSINFYSAGGGCTSFASVGDVVYHEYGHGINDNYYQSLGGFFINGAMGEGYADVWAFTITLNPILGEGTDAVNVSEFIRRYDVDPKVYPTDIVGEVHADGEIIAGAWWDTYLNLGNDMPLTLSLFVEAYAGMQAENFNGDEGEAFTEVLLDVLQADDTDADITNGTPNGTAIVDAFDKHGITLISNANLDHSSGGSAAASVPVTIEADLSLTFPWTNYLNNVKCFYQINQTGAWTAVNMTNSTGNTYTANIPAQPQGTLIGYYIGADDINGQLSAVKPIGAHLAEPNIPYFILVGYSLDKSHDGDFNADLGSWTTGNVSGDGATTGKWEETSPVGSFGTPGDTSTAVEPFYQHTAGGDICFVTGNSTSPTAALGTNDVDAGHTTLLSSVIDLSSYSNPVITYYRWYINNPPTGANPGADWWQVYVSDNGGSSWTAVENTKVSDKSWRRFAFRVQDYVNVNSNFRIKFIASDSTHIGQNLDGGSLIEAGVDDIGVWDLSTNRVDEKDKLVSFSVYPNPVSTELFLNIQSAENLSATIQVTDITGKLIYTQEITLGAGNTHSKIPVAALAKGMYHVHCITPKGKTVQKFTKQ